MKDHVSELLSIMARLRNKENGCPWDIEQNFESIAPYTLEEAYEVVDAIERGHMDDLKEELGDLLLQVVFHAQMAAEENIFSFQDVVEGLNRKLVSRHPHVFGDEAAKDSEDVLKIWQSAKEQERSLKNKTPNQSILDDVPNNFPALLRAQKISKKAAKSGFEWQKTENVIDKIIEELNELRVEIHSGDKEKQAEELGDVFFTLVNLGRRLDIQCEDAMRACNSKFYRRFSGMELDIKKDGRVMSDLSSEDWENYWNLQKSKERK